VVGLHEDDDAVTVEVRGPNGPYEVAARFLVGCDGARSRVRTLVGIPFPGTAFPEVERLASVTVPDSVTVLDDGGLNVPGVGTIPFGYTATKHGVFACSALRLRYLVVAWDGATPRDVLNSLARNLAK
jgi:2-polyprenyl-6-methoxyphenol hydroxylase-like FAD-dependent oxidoreductase